MTSKKKIVLAYSGGLDTSIILKWLQENYDADRSIDNLKKMLSTQKELIKCYTAYNIGCVASLKSSLKDDY